MADVSEPEEIDRFAREGNWFCPEWDANSYETIQAYISGELDLSAAVPRIADPIDECYSTADGGRAIHEAEREAEIQRQNYDAVKAEEMWGVPLRPDELPSIVDADKEANYKVHNTTACLLWDLWYGVLHAAKRIPWRDGEAAHLRLVALVRALKDRPDPPPPPPMSKALQNNWICASKRLWSELTVLGISTRESWNDSPGCGAGYELPEIHAWTNVNAFLARLTNLEVRDFLFYCVCSMIENLETEPTTWKRDVPVTATTQQNAGVPAAAVWIMVLGKELYDLAAGEASGNSERENFTRGGPLWKKHRDYKPTLSRERWRFWKERLGILRDRETLSQETRDIAAEAFRKMEEIENL